MALAIHKRSDTAQMSLIKGKRYHRKTQRRIVMSLFPVRYVRTRTAKNHLNGIKRKEKGERKEERERSYGRNNHRETMGKVCKVFKNM